MKAIIKMAGNKLRLALSIEGANDRTLLHMLIDQYPALWWDEDQHLSVPIFEGNQDIGTLLPARLEFNSDVYMETGVSGIVKAIHPIGARTIHGGALMIDGAENWTIVAVHINGRPQWNDHVMVAYGDGGQLRFQNYAQDGQILGDIVAGATVEVSMTRRTESGDGIFRAVIRAKD